jgi:hypothetical protein
MVVGIVNMSVMSIVNTAVAVGIDMKIVVMAVTINWIAMN